MTQQLLKYICVECSEIQQQICNTYGKPTECPKEADAQGRARRNRNRPIWEWGTPR